MNASKPMSTSVEVYPRRVIWCWVLYNELAYSVRLTSPKYRALQICACTKFTRIITTHEI